MSSICPQDLRFEYHPTGLGVPVASPRLSWRYAITAGDGKATLKNWFQTGYEIEIERTRRHGPDVMGFKVNSKTSALNPWPDSPLSSREQAKVRARAFGVVKSSPNETTGDALDSNWTEWKPIEAALLCRDDWTAKLITMPLKNDTRFIQPIRLRKLFQVQALPPQTSARLYASALGVYEIYLNGQKVGSEHLAPGWTSYKHRLYYQVYDVGTLIRPNQLNNLAIEVASGMYAGRLLWNDDYKFAFYGDRIAAFAQLEVTTGMGQAADFTLASDGSWEASKSPIIASSIYDGETYSLDLEEDGWNDTAPSASSSWQPVTVEALPEAQLLAAPIPPVKVTQTLKPYRISRSPSGKVLVDFGQNLVGKLCIHSLRRPSGHRLKVRHAEVLENGELGTRPLRTAEATDVVNFDGSRSLSDWSPHFTYHGFRYVEMEGWGPDDINDPLTVDSVSALVMHTDMTRTGSFECSNPMVNRFHENVVWTTRANMFSIPTDCPQRDERLGWTGDIQVFCPTASVLFDCDGLLASWMQDVIVDQKADGGIVPLVVPDVKIPWPQVPQAIWDDVVIILPWTLYMWFRDTAILRECYEGMKAYLDKTLVRGPDGLWTPEIWQLGDWLDPGAPPHDPGLSRTNGTLVADEYLIYVTSIMAKISRVLGHLADAKRYEEQISTLKHAFEYKYMAPSGLLVSDTQTALSLALAFKLHPKNMPERREAASKRLGDLVRYAQYRVSTGFAGTPQILHALSQTNQLQLSYRMLLEDQCPSWLYPVRMGATTIWERLDSMLEDGSINPGEMTSFNHYAMGSVASWIHAVVGGISPMEPGWKSCKVQPRPGGDIRSAKISYLSQSGKISTDWEIVNENSQETFKLSLTVPPNTSARIVLPNGDEKSVGSGDYVFECPFVAEGPWPPRPLYTAFRD